jgi:hypothetical protein
MCTNARGSSDQRRLVTLDPLGFEDVRHGTNLATGAASDDSADHGWPHRAANIAEKHRGVVLESGI